MPTPDSYRWFTETRTSCAPPRGATRSPCARWRCSASTSPTATSTASRRHRCSCSSPRTTCLTPTELALASYQKAREPKKLVMLPGGHFDAYTKGFDQSMVPARDWFLEHLQP